MRSRDDARCLIRKVSPAEKKTQHEKYKRLRDRVVSSLRKEKKKAAEESLRDGLDPWKVANRILGRSRNHDIPLVEDGTAVNNDEEKAEILNTYFIEKVSLLRSRIDRKAAADPR